MTPATIFQASAMHLRFSVNDLVVDLAKGDRTLTPHVALDSRAMSIMQVVLATFAGIDADRALLDVRGPKLIVCWRPELEIR